MSSDHHDGSYQGHRRADSKSFLLSLKIHPRRQREKKRQTLTKNGVTAQKIQADKIERTYLSFESIQMSVKKKIHITKDLNQ